ncbi:MAG: oxidoreductase [Bacteroidetes bacterium GWE2_41_25]|nr:MAG: oxidoreductase [Bacteroidetes bacterium GWA2_40_15]OFX84796.1 MAG: oxidoreductase [Bacteroidetes bacterium GWC2_40_22]OFY01441.1 MAG: oxidoreductase [Bacteroidetes bacterium GWE2_41_25]OFY57691.1 MAG: oxidoreductase [Bacteroidetes bacterium GWF2_41_9]HAM08837.1 gfo/Idh/MocA family oxidoreductase [Bacteroidales bacterium]
MQRKKIHFGIIGLGLMGKEFSSSIARWCHLLDNSPIPVVSAICDKNKETWKWYEDNFKDITIKTDDYKDLLNSKDIDAIYCAVPHNLHEKIYTDIINAGKHLLGEKPFGIDKNANKNILEAIKNNPEVSVRCSSEFPYFPACQQLIKWLNARKYGRLIEVRTGFHHSSDMDLNKPINWKRMVEINGEYGCMGDLGIHTLHIPFRMGWKPKNVYADLQKIAETRPDGSGGMVPCKTWDNAVLTCRSTDRETGKEFSMIIETKRMAPGSTNNWFIEVYGTEGSVIFSTHNPKAFNFLTTSGKEQGWTRIDVGSQSAIPTITGGIFEFGFSDAFQQMIGAFMHELSGNENKHPFGNVTPEETMWSHELFTAALQSGKTGNRVEIN